MELHAIGMLCALCAASFAALRSADRVGAALLALGFGAVLLVARPARFPEPAAVGAAATLLAALALARPRWWVPIALGAGAFAALWVSVLRAQGLPFVPASLLAAALPAAGLAFATRRSGFAPPVLREEALLLVGGLGLVVGLGAELVAGWRSAVVLSAKPLAGAPVPSAPWLAAFVLGCLGLGGLYSWWKRR